MSNHHRESRAGLLGRRIRFTQDNAPVTDIDHHDDGTSTITYRGGFYGDGTIRLPDNHHLPEGRERVFWENEDLIAHLREVLPYDVEEWHTGGGILNPVVVLTRDPTGEALQYLMPPDSGEDHGFTLCEHHNDLHSEDLYVNITAGPIANARELALWVSDLLKTFQSAFTSAPLTARPDTRDRAPGNGEPLTEPEGTPKGDLSL